MIVQEKIRIVGGSPRTGTATQSTTVSVGCRSDVEQYGLVPYSGDSTDYTDQIGANSLTDANCIFFSQTGNDTTGTGTRANPVFLPSKAASLANSGAKANCCFDGLAPYTYDDSVVMDSAINWYSNEFDCTINHSATTDNYTRTIADSTKNRQSGRVYAITATQLIEYTAYGETVIDSGLVNLCSISSYLDGVVALSWSTGNVYYWNASGIRSTLFSIPACSSEESQVSATEEAVFVMRNDSTATSGQLYGWDGSSVIDLDLFGVKYVTSSNFHSETDNCASFTIAYDSSPVLFAAVTCCKEAGSLVAHYSTGQYEPIQIIGDNIYAALNGTIYASYSLTSLSFVPVITGVSLPILNLEDNQGLLYYSHGATGSFDIFNVSGDIVSTVSNDSILGFTISNGILLSYDDGTNTDIQTLSCVTTKYNTKFQYYKFAGNELSTPINNDSATLTVNNCSIKNDNPIINSGGAVVLNNSLFPGTSGHLKTIDESTAPDISNCIFQNAQISIDSDSEVVIEDCLLTGNVVAIDAPNADATRTIFTQNGQDIVMTTDSTVLNCVISRWTGGNVIGQKYSSQPKLTNYLGLQWDARNVNPYADGGSLDFTEDLGAWKFSRSISIGSPEIDFVLPLAWDSINVSDKPANYSTAIAPSGEITDWFSNPGRLKRIVKITWNQDTGDTVNTWNHLAMMRELYSRENTVFRYGFSDGAGGWEPILSFTAYSGNVDNTVDIATTENYELNELVGFWIKFGSDYYRITASTKTATNNVIVTLDTTDDLTAISGGATTIDFMTVKVERGQALTGTAQKFFGGNLPITGYSITLHESELDDGELI